MRRESLKAEIIHPKLGSISLKAPTSTGKSIILYKIAEILKNEFGAIVVRPSLDQEMRGNDYTELSDWQKEMIKNTIWYLEEYQD